MCDDLAATIEKLSGAGASFGPANQERWGRIALMTIPGGAQLSIYEPSHPRARAGPGNVGPARRSPYNSIGGADLQALRVVEHPASRVEDAPLTA